MRVHDRLVHILSSMSLSRHFPASTQAILSAQTITTPPPVKKRLDKSIIIISSSPDDNNFRPPSPPQRVLCSDDEEYFGPARSSPPAPPRHVARKQRQMENVPVEVEDENFSRLLGEYKYTQTTRPLTTDTASIPRACTQKVNLDGFFQETKPLPKKPPPKSRVKTTLTSRVSLPKRTASSTTIKPVFTSTPSVTRDNGRFFTTWAAAQAPSTRAKPTAKPRRKPTRRKDSVEVVLLSPRTGQENVRKRVVEEEEGERRLGEKSRRGSMMWDACKRGLDGELYDC